MLPTLTKRRGRGGWMTPMDLLENDFDRMLGRWWNEAGEDLVGKYPVDIHEDADSIYVEAELPGFTKDQVEVTMENGVLHIAAERKAEEAKGEKHLSERRFTRVARSFTLPNTVDPEKLEARLSDGVLHLKLAKREQVKPRRVQIR